MLASRFHLDKPTECPQCGNPLETYIGEPPLGFVGREITTVGQQGERNFKALGKVKGEEFIAKQKEEKEKAEQELVKKHGMKGKLADVRKANKLDSLTPEQKIKYIHTGKLPPGK